jgi:putative hydrolase of the HAD superfamily
VPSRPHRPRARPPVAATLDAAGTLIRPARPVGETYAETAARHGTEISAQALMQAFRAVFPRMPPLAFPLVEPHELDLLERGWWRRLVREVLATCDATVEPFDAFFTDLYQAFARPDAWAPYPEVPAALEALRAAGIRLAVVSNFDSRLEPILAGLGLDRHVEAVVYSTRAGAAKPDPRLFHAALALLGVEPRDAVHVGDSIEADYEGAETAGLTGIWLARGDTPAAANSPTPVADLAAFCERLVGS